MECQLRIRSGILFISFHTQEVRRRWRAALVPEGYILLVLPSMVER
jgi:hypothetical protein